MTITTSKQLAEALGPGWSPLPFVNPEAYLRGSHCNVWRHHRSGWRAGYDGLTCRGPTPRAAVLALADKLEAEAKALRESVRKEEP